MRRIALLFGAAIATTASAQLTFERPVVQLGVVKAVGAVEHRFPFKATGDQPVEIVDVRPSCGCIRTPLAKKIFEPGESGAIPLVIHVASQAEGKKRFELTLTVRDPTERTIVLSAEADLQSDVKVEPSNLVVQLHDGQSSTHLIAVRDRRPRPLKIDGAVVSNPAMSARLVQERTDAHEHWIEVSIGPNLKTGRHNERLEIRALTTENPAFPEKVVLEIPINVLRPSTFTLLPERVVVKRSALAEGKLSRTVTMIDRTGSSPDVQVESGDPNVRAAARRESLGVVKLKVAVHPAARSTKVRILTNGKPAAELPVEIVD